MIEENRLTGVNEEHTRLLKRMIDRDRNHPCIILWSVGNEEWGIEWKENGTRIAATMREYCHRFDPTRLMTVASSSGPAILIPADVAGYNYILQNPVEQHRKDYPGAVRSVRKRLRAVVRAASTSMPTTKATWWRTTASRTDLTAC